MKRTIFVFISTMLNIVLFAQNELAHKQSIGFENDLFVSLTKEKFILNTVDYPVYQFAFSYNHYYWNKDIVHASFSAGIGMAKTTYNFEANKHRWFQHHTIHIPLEAKVLLGRKKSFFFSGIGIFYNGKRIANIRQVDELVEDDYYWKKYFIKNTVYIYYKLGFKHIFLKHLIFDFSILSGRRDIAHFDLDYSNGIKLSTHHPHFQIKIEYLF